MADDGDNGISDGDGTDEDGEGGGIGSSDDEDYGAGQPDSGRVDGDGEEFNSDSFANDYDEFKRIVSDEDARQRDEAKSASGQKGAARAGDENYDDDDDDDDDDIDSDLNIDDDDDNLSQAASEYDMNDGGKSGIYCFP
jgi:hypothetical protein